VLNPGITDEPVKVKFLNFFNAIKTKLSTGSNPVKTKDQMVFSVIPVVDSQFAYNHDLGGPPHLVRIYLKCTVLDRGKLASGSQGSTSGQFVADDVVYVDSRAGSDASMAFSVMANATQIVVGYNNDTIRALNKVQQIVTLTKDRWQVYVAAMRFTT
jgi:hypothetical protein